jgi:hypothetical protein
MRCPGSLACSGELDVESDKGAEVVWEVFWSGVSSMEGFGAPFKGGRREARAVYRGNITPGAAAVGG